MLMCCFRFYFNEYEFEKITDQMETIKKYNQLASTEKSIVGTLKMVELDKS